MKDYSDAEETRKRVLYLTPIEMRSAILRGVVQRMRTEEIEAIEKAVEIMSGDPSSAADEHMSLTQQGSSSLLQVARSFNTQSNPSTKSDVG